MNILICGGVKTQNIIRSLEKKLSSGGINLICVENIESIEDLLNVGNTFDRAIIIEQGWNNDGNDTDEYSIRNRLNSFCNAMATNHKKGMSYIYLTQTEESASIVYDETSTLYNESVIVIQKPPYSVTFFTDMVKNDLSDLNSYIIYNPIIEEENLEEEKQEEEKEIYFINEEDDLSSDLFGELAESNFDDFIDSIEYTEEGIELEEEVLEEEVETTKPTEENKNYEQENIEDNLEVEEEIELDDLDNEEEIELDDLNNEEEIELDKIVSTPIKEDTNKNIGNNKKEDLKVNVGKEKKRGLFRKEKTKRVDKKIPKVINNRYEVTNNLDSIKETFSVFASRGNSIVVSGFGGSGASTIAFNLANTICNLGFSVLLVDMDTVSRAQSYISNINYESMSPDGINLLEALKSASNINGYVAVTKPGFRLLSMGIAGDIIPLSKMIEPHKITKFINLAKNNHNFIIYDIPFNSAVNEAKDIIYSADNIVLAVDGSNWGITKAMLGICNIESDDMQELIFTRAQMVLNRVTNLNTLMGKKVSNLNDIVNIIDGKVESLLGFDTGYYFSDIGITGIINEMSQLKDNWFNNYVYSDTSEGKEMFARLLKDIVLKKDNRLY